MRRQWDLTQPPIILGGIAIPTFQKHGLAQCEGPRLINGKFELVPDEKANLLDKVYGYELLPLNY